MRYFNIIQFIGFFWAIGAFLIIIKVLNGYGWSWWAVTAPIYAPLLFLSAWVIYLMSKFKKEEYDD